MKIPLLALESVAALNPSRHRQAMPNPDRKAHRVQGKVGYVSAEMLRAGALEIEPGDAFWADCVRHHHGFEVGDVLLPAHLSGLKAGAVALVQKRVGVCPQRVLVLRADPARLDARYLLYFLRQKRMQNIIAVFAGAASGRAPSARALLRQLGIPVPPLFQQKNRVRQLDHAHTMQQRWQEEVKSRETSRRLFFHTFFGTTATMQSRFPVAPLHTVLDLMLPGGAGLLRYQAEQGEWVIRPHNLGANRVLLDDCLHVQLPTGSGRRCRVMAGDVLLALRGAHIGHTACVPPGVQALAGAGVAILRTTALAPRFLAGYLHSGTGLGEMERVRLAAATRNLTLAILKTMRVMVPPLAMQQEFVLADRELEADCDAAYARLVQARASFAQLEHEAFQV